MQNSGNFTEVPNLIKGACLAFLEKYLKLNRDKLLYFVLALQLTENKIPEKFFC
jgi:hypothetical protein